MDTSDMYRFLHNEAHMGFSFMTIYPTVNFGKNVKLGNYIVIEKYCSIGDNVLIGNCVTLRPETVIGNDCKIGHNTVIEGKCFIGDGTSIQANCYIPWGTEIEEKVFIGPGVVGSNDRSIYYGRDPLILPHRNKAFVIRRGARIGAGVVILPEVEIGENAFVAAGAVVAHNAIPNGRVCGIPAKTYGEVPLSERI